MPTKSRTRHPSAVDPDDEDTSPVEGEDEEKNEELTDQAESAKGETVALKYVSSAPSSRRVLNKTELQSLGVEDLRALDVLAQMPFGVSEATADLLVATGDFEVVKPKDVDKQTRTAWELHHPDGGGLYPTSGSTTDGSFSNVVTATGPSSGLDFSGNGSSAVA